MVRIQLRNSGSTIQETVLRDNGFEFLNVPWGHYTLVAEAPGYETALQDVDVPGGWPVIELQTQRKPVRPTEVLPVWDLRVPPSARRQFEAARVKLQENNCVDALDHLKKAVHKYGEYGEAHKVMAVCYERMNQLEAAEQEFKRALEQPHAPDLHLLLGKIYAREGDRGLLERQLGLYAEEKSNQQRDRK